MVIAKFLASSATLIGYYIFISVTQILLSSNLESLKVVPLARQLFIILFLCGGGLATMAFSDIVASFLGESVGIREARASFKSTMAGGMMAMGAAKMTGRALGFMKSKRGQKKSTNTNNTNDFNPLNKVASTETAIDNSSFRSAATGMVARSGIVGLLGLGIGAIGATAGHIAAESRKS